MKPGTSRPPSRSCAGHAGRRVSAVDDAAIRPSAIATALPSTISFGRQDAAINENRLHQTVSVTLLRCGGCRDRSRAPPKAHWPFDRSSGSSGSARSPGARPGRAARRPPSLRRRPAARRRRSATSLAMASTLSRALVGLGEDQHREAFLHQGHRAVQHLGGAEGLGVQAAGLLELQGRLLGDAEADAASQHIEVCTPASGARRPGSSPGSRPRPAGRAGWTGPAVHGPRRRSRRRPVGRWRPGRRCRTWWPPRSARDRRAAAAPGRPGRPGARWSSLTRAMTKAPAALAASTAASRSGLLPDCEIGQMTARRPGPAGRRRPKLTDRAADEVSTPVRVSTRYLAKVAAWSQEPRAQVTTARGGWARRRSPILAARAAVGGQQGGDGLRGLGRPRGTCGSIRRRPRRPNSRPWGRRGGGAGRVKTLGLQSRRSYIGALQGMGRAPGSAGPPGKGVQLGDEVVGVAAVVGLGDLDRPAVLQEAAALDQQARRP